ncbi:hypothetical protein KCV06_g618, partial [Aureobasidium melanogenum]
MTKPATSFHLFGRLPPELRLQIWQYCLPYRVFELDFSLDEYVFWSYREYLDPPLTFAMYPLTYNASKWASATHQPFDFEDAWVDKTHGAPHLNWTSTYEAQFCWAGYPINCMIWESRKFSATPSIMVGLLDTRTFGPQPFHEETEFIDAYKTLPSWLVVMHVVVVHSDLSSAAATGLFGLLGDAPVQIIPVSEEAKIDSFYDLAERCERGQDVTASQDFTRKSADEMRQELRKEVWSRFKSEDLVAIMHPAIMFRLCTQMCNHNIEAHT